MNARTDSLSAAVVDPRIATAVQFTDTLVLDLYGSLPEGDPEDGGGYIVSGVSVSGCAADISELFTKTQLDSFATWLDYKDSSSDALRRVADRALTEATRPPFERNRCLG